MPTISIDVPEELSDELAKAGDQLPELLARSLRQPPLSAEVYQYILRFLASGPTPEQIAEFRPTAAMVARLNDLVARSKLAVLSSLEVQELDEFDRIEHLMIMLKAGNVPYVTLPQQG